MHETAAVPAWVMLAYLVAGVCFILALAARRASERVAARNRFGMFGMATR
jgi:NAD(P) transhydrogenase subunit beta